MKGFGSFSIRRKESNLIAEGSTETGELIAGEEIAFCFESTPLFLPF